MRVSTLVTLSFLAGLPAGAGCAHTCRHQQPAAVDLRPALMELDREFDRVTAREGSRGFGSFFAPDGLSFPGGEPVRIGPTPIAASLAALDRPGTSLRWTPLGAEVSRSGDLGYTYGSYVFRSTRPDGTVKESRGRYVTIWRRQPDGGWKAALDIGNPGPPPSGGHQ